MKQQMYPGLHLNSCTEDVWCCPSVDYDYESSRATERHGFLALYLYYGLYYGESFCIAKVWDTAQ